MDVIEIATAFVAIRPQTDGFESELAAAVGGLEQEVPLTADTSDLEAGVESVAGEEVEVGVTADTSDAEGAIDGIEAAPVEVPVSANTEEAQASINDLGGSIEALSGAAGVGGGAVGGITSELGGLVGLSSGATIGITAVAGGLAYAAGEASEAQVTVGQLDQMVENMGANAGVTSQGLQALATDIQTTAGFSDEAVMAGESMVLMFENVRNTADQPIFDRTIKSAADLARSPAFNGDISSAARTLGRALDDPVAGMSRLRRAGIQLTESQQATITSLQESGDLVGAQAALLDIVDSKVGGLAETYAGTYAGSLDRAKEAVGEMAEALGAQMLPALEAVALSVTDQVQRLNSWDDALNGALLSGPIQAIMGLGDGIEGVGSVVGELPPPLRDTAAAAAEAGAEINDLNQDLDAYLQALFGVPDAQRDLRQSFGELTDAVQTGTWDDQAVAMENVVASTAAMIAKQREQGATTRELDGTIYGSIATLARMRDQGQITGAQFDTLSGQIAAVPHQATTVVSAPGADGALRQLREVKTTIDGIPRSVVVQVSVPNLGAIAADVAGAASSLRSLRGAESASAGGAALTRPTVGGATSTIVHQTVLDGRVLTETVNDINYIGAIAEGYEQ